MASVALVSILSLDRVGLVSAIADYLFTAGVNLRDTTFAALGKGAEFTSVCELPDDVSAEALLDDLELVPELQGAQIRVVPYGLAATRRRRARGARSRRKIKVVREGGAACVACHAWRRSRGSRPFWSWDCRRWAPPRRSPARSAMRRASPIPRSRSAKPCPIAAPPRPGAPMA